MKYHSVQNLLGLKYPGTKGPVKDTHVKENNGIYGKNDMGFTSLTE